jgi:hypothetical protein
MIDDLAFFNKALTSSEVNELYQGMTLGEYLGAGSGTTKLLLHLNGNSTDSSGNNNNGTDTAITWVDGKFGKCASFNGSTSFIDYASLPIQLDKTIIAWVYTGTNNAWQEIFSQSRGSRTDYYATELRLTNAGKLQYTEASYAGSINSSLISSANFPLNQWVMVAVTCSGTSIKLYVNGVNTDSTTFTRVSSFTPSHSIVGAYKFNDGSAAGFNMNGKIDELILDAPVMTPQQVAKYYTYTKGRF